LKDYSQDASILHPFKRLEYREYFVTGLVKTKRVGFHLAGSARKSKTFFCHAKYYSVIIEKASTPVLYNQYERAAPSSLLRKQPQRRLIKGFSGIKIARKRNLTRVSLFLGMV